MRPYLIVIGVIAPLVLAGCQTTAPVNRPCGVITDSLLGVDAKTSQGQSRLDRHYERGVAAKCWKRGE